MKKMAKIESWRKRLGDLVHRKSLVVERNEKERERSKSIISDIILSSLRELKAELEKHGYKVYMTENRGGYYPYADLTLKRNGVTVMVYRIRVALDNPDMYKIEPLYGETPDKVIEHGTAWILRTNEYGLHKETIFNNFISCYEDGVAKIAAARGSGGAG